MKNDNQTTRLRDTSEGSVRLFPVLVAQEDLSDGLCVTTEPGQRFLMQYHELDSIRPEADEYEAAEFDEVYEAHKSELNRVRTIAKAICAQCPVQVECLDTGLKLAHKPGMFGGMTQSQRKNMIKETGRKVKGNQRNRGRDIGRKAS